MRSVSGALTQKQTFVSWFERRAGLLERLQRRVALEALCKRGSSFGTKLVVPDTVRMGLEVGTEPCEGADRKANTPGAGGALELLEHTVPLDAARDDDGGHDPEALVGEVDLLGRLRALELVDLKSVTIDTARGRACGVSAGRGHKSEHAGSAVGVPGLLERLQLRRCADCGSER